MRVCKLSASLARLTPEPDHHTRHRRSLTARRFTPNSLNVCVCLASGPAAILAQETAEVGYQQQGFELLQRLPWLLSAPSKAAQAWPLDAKLALQGS